MKLCVQNTIGRVSMDEETIKTAITALYKAVYEISRRTGLSVSSITGSINHSHEIALLEQVEHYERTGRKVH